MTVFQIILTVYLTGSVISAGVVMRIARDKPAMRLLSGLLIGATWPLSLPVALLFALF